MTTLSEFFSNYPEIGSDDFESRIASKEEFNLSGKTGKFFPYQELVSRFINSHTPYNGLLVAHSMGTGKTCTAIRVVEKNLDAFSGAIILAPNDILLKNFQNELMTTCTNGKYVPENFETFETRNKQTREIAIATSYYKFETFEKFARHLNQIALADPTQITNKFDNKIWIFDEAHEINEKKDAIQFKMFQMARDLCPRSRFLFLTGTPMIDDVTEIQKLLNLLLPKDIRIKNILNLLFDDGRAKHELRQLIRGRVSFLKSNTKEIKKTYIGELIGDASIMDKFQIPLFVSIMDKFQIDHYLNILKQDDEFYIQSRHADLAVFPNGQVRDDNGEFVNSYTKKLKPAGSQYFNHNLDNLKKVSSKYWALLKRLEVAKSNNRRVYVYSNFVHGVAIHYLLAILDHFNFSNFTTYLDPTFSPADTEELIAKINLNKDFQIIVGSHKTATGITLKNIQQVEILTPFWNFKTILQAIARGARIGSQKDIENPVYEVALYVALPESKTLNDSISFKMYKTAQEKDIKINHLERDLQECSIDCWANYERNFVEGFDNQPECQYLPCDFKCVGIESQQITDQKTFNLFFSNQLFDEIRAKFVDYFEQKSAIATFQQLLQIGKNKFVICQVLESLIETNYLFRHFFVLREESDVFFLAPLFDKKWQPRDSWFIENPIIFCHSDNGADILEKFVNKKLVEYISKGEYTPFYLFSREDQCNIFENFWKFQSHRDTEMSEYFSNFVDIKNNVHWILAPQIRQFVDGQWVDAPQDIADRENARLSEEQNKQMNNEFGILTQFTKRSMIEKDHLVRESLLKREFCIRDLFKSDPQDGKQNQQINKKKSEKIFGLRCKSHKKEELQDIAARLGISSNGNDNVLCDKIFEKSKSLGLLVEDPNCGIQEKQKS